jgi:hypothetical protein
MMASLRGMSPLREAPNYRLVRFEDVCDRPMEAAEAVYGWLGFPLHADAAAWVETSTHAATVRETRAFPCCHRRRRPRSVNPPFR